LSRAFRGTHALHWIHALFLILLLLVVFLFIFPRIFVIVLAHHKAFVERQLSRWIKSPVTMGQLTANPASFYPSITVRKVAFSLKKTAPTATADLPQRGPSKPLKPPETTVIVKINQLTVSVNPVASLFFRKWVLSYFSIYGGGGGYKEHPGPHSPPE